MRLLLTAAVLLAILGFGPPAAQRNDTTASAVCELKVQGLVCGACAVRFEREARKIKGVRAANVDHADGRATITYDPAMTSPETIAKTVTERSGFTTSVVDRS